MRLRGFTLSEFLAPACLLALLGFDSLAMLVMHVTLWLTIPEEARSQMVTAQGRAWFGLQLCGMIVNALIWLAFVADGLRSRNIQQIIAFSYVMVPSKPAWIWNSDLLLWTGVWKILEHSDPSRRLHTALDIKDVLVLVVYILLTILLYRQFKWEVYKIAGADPRHQRMWVCYLSLLVYIKLTAGFLVSLCIPRVASNLLTAQQVLLLKSGLPSAMALISIALIPMTYYATRRENAAWMFFGVIGSLFALIVLLIADMVLTPKKDAPSALGLQLAAVSLFTAFVSLYNFGQGLQPYHEKQSRHVEPDTHNIDLEEQMSAENEYKPDNKA